MIRGTEEAQRKILCYSVLSVYTKPKYSVQKKENSNPTSRKNIRATLYMISLYYKLSTKIASRPVSKVIMHQRTGPAENKPIQGYNDLGDIAS